MFFIPLQPNITNINMAKALIIGREREQDELRRLTESSSSEFVAVYGRRRVGKTYLVKEFYNQQFDFYATGICRGNRRDQIKSFNDSLVEYGSTDKSAPKDWFEAFNRLKSIVANSSNSKKVIFLDELPWMDTPKSNFIQALDLFWNKWCSSRNDIVLIVCGSAASWMVKNLIRNKGGLHNRLTCKIHLQPFTLAEADAFLRYKGIRWSKQAVAECYMIMGGIPFYLQHLHKSMSLAQNIDRMFFNPSALLEDEFHNLYNSLFTNSEDYIKIVRALNSKKKGMTRSDLVAATKIADGGGLTRKLDELEQCGFIRKYTSIGVSRFIYQLVDFYTLFFYQFINGGKEYDEDTWMHLQGQPRHTAWLGLSFEKLCFAHSYEIKHALGISGIGTKTYALNADGAQIDMVIERADKFLNLCEMKFSAVPYSISKSEWDKIQRRIAVVAEKKPNRSVLLTMVTSQGLKQNEYSQNGVQKVLTIEDLF